MADHLEVSYCEGWDPQIRAGAGPLSSVRAADRDRAGEQYAVLLAVSGQPVAIIEVAWADHYCGVSFFDEQLRRVYQYDSPRLDEGRLFMARGAEWNYSDADESEFDDQAGVTRWVVSLDGHMEAWTRWPGEDGLNHRADQEVEPPWFDAPEFGDWGPFICGFAPLEDLGHDVSPKAVIDVSDQGGDGLPIGLRPWHPPRPLQPAHLDLLFSPGTRFMCDHDETVLVEVRSAGTLRMPSGKLIAADPAMVDADLECLEPFKETVPPGDYPVLLSLLYWPDDPEYQRVAAAKLAIRDGAVTSWEPALLPGEDPRILADGEFFGFEAPTGPACFFDAVAAPALAPLTGTLDLGDAASAELTDPGSGANLIAFDSTWGEGSYPTWIGRTADGDVACFIADMMLLGGDMVPDGEQASLDSHAS